MVALGCECFQAMAKVLGTQRFCVPTACECKKFKKFFCILWSLSVQTYHGFPTTEPAFIE